MHGIALLFAALLAASTTTQGRHIRPSNRNRSSVLHHRSSAVTDQITWDGYSLSIKGQRVFMQGGARVFVRLATAGGRSHLADSRGSGAGEFHPWRLPVPGQWDDVRDPSDAISVLRLDC